MVKRAPGDTAFRDPLDDFTDRQTVLKTFRQYLRSPHGNNYLLAIKGNSGAGKTYLISYLSKRVCPKLKLQWHAGHLSFIQSGEPNFQTIFASLEHALEGCVPIDSFQSYRLACEEYIHDFDTYRNSVFISVDIDVDNQSSISGLDSKIQVDTQLRERELHLRSELTQAFIELAKTRQHPLCLFVDGYEYLNEAAPELVVWLFHDLLHPISQASVYPLRVLICGWEWPKDIAVEPFSVERAVLEDFDQVQVRDYLQKRKIIVSTSINATSAQSEQGGLVDAFYDLTQGHPLMLGLAVTYFNNLAKDERTIENLQAHRDFINEQARIEFLQGRLLERLAEPYRTLLERGPILRFFDQAALRVLLNVEIEGSAVLGTLDDRTYERFLRYPFINHEGTSRDPLPFHPTFHDLVRRVRLEALRRLHPETKELLHFVVAGYYKQMAEAELDRRKHPLEGKEDTPNTQFVQWFEEVPQKEFRAWLEYFYQALQVKQLQAEVFKTWEAFTRRAVTRWRRSQAGPLLEVMRQLVEEGEPFLDKTRSYAQYLTWSSEFVLQEARWEEAKIKLEEAATIFESVGDLADLANCFDHIGFIHQAQGKLVEALSSHERALRLLVQTDRSVVGIATAIHNIGFIHYSLGHYEQALSYYKRAIPLYEQAGYLDGLSSTLNNIGLLYYAQDLNEQALSYYARDLEIRERIGGPIEISTSLNNIGAVYERQEDWEKALYYHEQALLLKELIGDPASIATSLHNIGRVLIGQGKLQEALGYHEQALVLRQKVGNPAAIANSLNNIGHIYNKQGKLQEALSYYERALALDQEVGIEVQIAINLHNIGCIYCEQRQLEQAIVYFVKSLNLFEGLESSFVKDVAQELRLLAFCHVKLGDIRNSLLYFDKIGDIYRQQGDFEQALIHYKSILAIREGRSDPDLIATLLNNIDSIFSSQEELEESLIYYRDALTSRERVDDSFDIAACLISIGSIYQEQGELEEALRYYERALALQEHVNSPEEILDSFYRIGHLYIALEKLEETLRYYERALLLREKMGNPADIANALDMIGTIYEHQQEWEQALSYYEQALIRRRTQDNSNAVAQSLHNIGFVYQQQGKFAHALSYFEQALTIWEQVGTPDIIAASLHNIGFIYQVFEKLNKALECYERSLTFWEQVDNPGATAQTLLNIGMVYKDQGKLDQALVYYERALKIREQLSSKGETAIVLHNIAEVYRQQGKITQAISRYEDALRHYESLGPGSQLGAAKELEALAACYALTGELMKAFDYSRRAKRIREEYQETQQEVPRGIAQE